jgi:hypothetical protein
LYDFKDRKRERSIVKWKILRHRTGNKIVTIKIWFHHCTYFVKRCTTSYNFTKGRNCILSANLQMCARCHCQFCLKCFFFTKTFTRIGYSRAPGHYTTRILFKYVDTVVYVFIYWRMCYHELIKYSFMRRSYWNASYSCCLYIVIIITSCRKMRTLIQ